MVPAHTGVLLDATGVAGMAFTVTVVETDGPVQPFKVALTV